MEAKHRQSFYYNRRAKPRPTLPVGQNVRMCFDEGDWRKAEILRVLPHRAYQLQLEDGSTRRSTSLHVTFSSEPPLTSNDDAWNGAPTSTDRSTTAVSTGRHALAPPCSRPRLTGDIPPSQPDQQQKPSAKADAPDAASKTTRSGRIVRRPAR